MANKPPRLDLAAAMEAELSADALGPRSAWGTPQSTSAHASHATHSSPSLETANLPSQQPSVPPSSQSSVHSSLETVGFTSVATSGAPDAATILPSTHETSNTTDGGAGAPDPAVTPAPSPMRPGDNGSNVSTDPSDQRLLMRSYVPPSRQGAMRISAYCSARVMKQVRMMAVNQDCTIDDLVTRALDLLFKAEGLPAIAFDGKPFGRSPDASEKGTG